jgi:hypothetical protein
MSETKFHTHIEFQPEKKLKGRRDLRDLSIDESIVLNKKFWEERIASDTDRIQNDASNNALLPQEHLY